MSEFMPTMADVAREAGVSKMTVSRVLADRDVSVAMRERVLAVIEQLGYVPDASAGTLSSGRSPFIVALVPSMSSSNFADTVHSLNAAVTAHGLQLLLGDTDYDLKQEEQLLRVMLAHRPEGVMLTGSYHTAATRAMLKRSKVPVVETWDVPRTPIQQAVGFSNVDAACEMMRHLHERGTARRHRLARRVPPRKIAPQRRFARAPALGAPARGQGLPGRSCRRRSNLNGVINPSISTRF